MDRTKIPKPSHTKTVRIGPTSTFLNSKTNETKTENKPIKNLLQSRPIPTFSRNLLRRSKSAADLTTLSRKPITEFKKSVLNTKPTISTIRQQAQKRPAPTTNKSDESKPKIQKVKIPDWDYKSRFGQLLEKHKGLQETCKSLEQRLSNLANVEEDLGNYKKQTDTLTTTVNKLENEIQDFETNNTLLTKENTALKSENNVLTENLTTITKEHEALLIKEKANLNTIKVLTNKNNIIEQKLETLTEDHILLVNNYETLKNSAGKLQTEYDTKLKESEILKDKLDDAMKKIKSLEANVCNMKKDIQEHENLRRSLHNTIQDLKGNIRVFCRVRPPINNEELERIQCNINYLDEASLDIRKSRESVNVISGKLNDLRLEFTFDKVFPPFTTQKTVFEELALLVQSALDGYHVCVFAYGQTGSGKTYTMQGGNNSNDLGMIPRTIDLTFEQMNKLQRAGWTYTVEASFLEIYNENVRDLLNINSNQNYDIYYNEGKGITVKNLKIEQINSASELKQLMYRAHQNRAVAATDFNEHSSRSHAVTKIYLQGRNEDNTTVYTGSLNLVDLAGSESAKTSSNERLQETKNINKSLSTLGSVMLALHNNDSHVPYRNSKLTYLLQSCLGGNSKTLMFVNIAPFEECYGESVNSLRFASKVKEIKTGSKKNKTVNVRS